MRKITSLFMAALLCGSLLAGCGSSTQSGGDPSPGGGDTPAPPEGSAASITFFHSKGEIHEALEEMAKVYEAQTGVHVEVQVAGAGESPYTKITTAYNSGTPPTLAMLDTTDIVSLGEEKAVDLSGEEWISECADSLTYINDKVYSFPFCIEGRGIIYSKQVIEDTLGAAFDPSSITTRDALAELLQSLRDAGMENPMVISKEDWSLGAHQLQYIYETKDGTNGTTAAVIEQIKDGSLDVLSYDRFNGFLDTLDLLLEYNYNKRDPLGAVYERDPIHLVDGEAALWFNGCWAWPNIAEAGADASEEYGFLPYVLSNDPSDFANTQIQASASKQVMIDREKATEQEIQAAKDFLNWLVFDEAGQKALVEGCAIIPAANNNSVPVSDPLGADIKERLSAGGTFPASAIVPGDHWSVLGGAMQKYIAGQSSREELAQGITSYWAEQ